MSSNTGAFRYLISYSVADATVHQMLAKTNRDNVVSAMGLISHRKKKNSHVNVHFKNISHGLEF